MSRNPGSSSTTRMRGFAPRGIVFEDTLLSKDPQFSFATAGFVSPAPTDTDTVFVRPSSALTNLTVCAPGLTVMCTLGVLPSDRPSRKQVEGGIELIFKKASGPSVAAGASAAAAGSARSTTWAAGRTAGAAAGAGWLYDTDEAQAPVAFGSSVTR